MRTETQQMEQYTENCKGGREFTVQTVRKIDEEDYRLSCLMMPTFWGTALPSGGSAA